MNDKLLQQVVWILGAVILASLAIIGYLLGNDKGVPDILVAIPSAALTGLVGLLVPRTPSNLR